MRLFLYAFLKSVKYVLYAAQIINNLFVRVIYRGHGFRKDDRFSHDAEGGLINTVSARITNCFRFMHCLFLFVVRSYHKG